MRFPNLWRQLKKQLRVKKRWLSLGTILLLAGGSASGQYLFHLRMQEAVPVFMTPGSPSEQGNLLRSLEGSSAAHAVRLKRIYVCGEEVQSLGLMNGKQIVEYSKEHPGYSVDLEGKSGDRAVVFSESIDDLAPRCKESAYFGLDGGGNLSLFDGIPANEQVIRTFFQLDVHHVKSSLPADVWKQLNAGIRVTDLAEFNSVLSTFSDFAVVGRGSTADKQ